MGKISEESPLSLSDWIFPFQLSGNPVFVNHELPEEFFRVEKTEESGRSRKRSEK